MCSFFNPCFIFRPCMPAPPPRTCLHADSVFDYIQLRSRRQGITTRRGDGAPDRPTLRRRVSVRPGHWVVSACTRIDPTGLHQAQHEPQRIRGVSVRCRGTETIFIRYGTQGIVSAYICDLSSSPTEDSGDKESTSYIEKPRARRRVCDVFITTWNVRVSY